jgi:hypothetical protein
MVWHEVGYGRIDFYKIMLSKKHSLREWVVFCGKRFERVPQNHFLTAVAKAAA